LKKNKLPLDPFDPSTPLNADYQLGSFAWAILLIGLAAMLFLVATANLESWTGWAKVICAVLVVFGVGGLARLLWRQL
jgi:hypothetical protein